MRRISIGAFILVLALVIIGAGIASVDLWHNLMGLANQLAGESLVVAIASLLIAFLAGVIATIAFFQSTRQPLLRLRTRINADYIDPQDRFVQDDDQVEKGESKEFARSRFNWLEGTGPALWIELHNLRNVAALHPAVRVELLAFDIPVAVIPVQTGWRSVPPQERGAFAWLWSGDERTVHGPGWSEALPPLNLHGSFPRASSTSSRMIKISAVADDADEAQQRLTFV